MAEEEARFIEYLEEKKGSYSRKLVNIDKYGRALTMWIRLMIATICTSRGHMTVRVINYCNESMCC